MTTDFESILEEDGVLVYPNVGTSMMPMLRQHRDVMVIKKRPQGRLKKYDAVLYKRGRLYILHRIIKVRHDDYVICGDNCTVREYGVTDADIIGVLIAFVRDGREISVDNVGYRLYVHLWCDFFHVRVGILRLKAVASAVVRRIRTLKEKE